MSPIVLVSLQLVLYAVLWLLAAIGLRQGRSAMLHWCAYALCSTLATGLLTLRAAHPGWLTIAGASMAFLLSLVLARRGVELFLKLRTHDLEYAIVIGVAVAGLAWIGIAPDVAWQRATLVSSLSVLILLVGTVHCWRGLKAEFGMVLAVSAAFSALAMALLHVSQVLLAWRNADALRAASLDAGAIPGSTWPVVLISAAAFNYLFLFMVAMRLVNKLRRQARHDPLTGLLNRRSMMYVLNSEWERHRRGGPPFTLIYGDIDFFKRINDEHGHGGGDEILRQVAHRLQAGIRSVDRLGRVGGEELMLLLPGCDAASAGREAAERLRVALADKPVPLPADQTLRVTASWGVSGPLPTDAGVDEVIARADAALYQAKAGGRNCVMLG